jgi:ribosomal protein L29
VRWTRRWDEEHLVKAELIRGGARDCQVGVVNGVERAAEKRQFHQVAARWIQLATGQLDNTGRISVVKKDIARLRTEMRGRELRAQREAAAS